MCVIIYKPKGIELPSIELLTKAYQRNPHGCGLVTPSIQYKGLSFESFKRHLKQCSADEPMLIHFRYATHGSVKKANCHPFYDEATDTYFMHNGVIGGIYPKGDKTDSETAFRSILVPYISRYGMHSNELTETVNQIKGFSKFAFMQNGEVTLFGDYIYQDGLCFSNLRFL